MNTDSTRPSVAPKPRFVGHAGVTPRSPVMSAARGPKPSIAPKPTVAPELSGSRRGCANGSVLTDGEVGGGRGAENGLNRRTAPEEQINAYILPVQKHREEALHGFENGEVTGGEEEEDASQRMDEDWRLTDSALTEDVDSLDTPWPSDAGLALSEEAVEMTDTDLTEDMDAEACDAGEGLADTDGLSVGDFSVNSLDEEKQGSPRIPELGACDCTAEDWSEAQAEKPSVPFNENMEDAGTRALLGDEDAKESDCSITCSILGGGCKEKERSGDLQNLNNNDFILEDLRYFCDSDDTLEEELANESYYVSSGDIIKGQLISRTTKAHGPPQSPQTPHRPRIVNRGAAAGKYEQVENGPTSVSPENRKKTGNGVEDEAGARKKSASFTVEEREVRAAEASPRYRLVSVSVATDTDASLTSSLSESQLFSPNGSDVFSDPDAHMVPFLDEASDAERDVSDEHVYEEPGHSSQAETVFPVDRKAAGTRSRSLIHCANTSAADVGGHRSYVSGFGPPALSSSPMLVSTRHRSVSKPQYLSLHPRSLSVEGPDLPLCVFRDREGAICSSGSFSRCSPLSSGLSTPMSAVDIPPPFELASITKKPIAKSSPSLLAGGDSPEKNRKKKSSIKRFLMLRFRRKAESKPAVDASPSSPQSSRRAAARLPDPDRHSAGGSPRLRPQLRSAPASAVLLYKESGRRGGAVAFLTRSVVRVESFEDRSRAPFTPLPLTKPRSISFPNADTSDYENVPAISSDYENLQVPQRRPVRQVPFPNYFDRPSRALSPASETDGYVDMSSLPGFERKSKSPQQEAESAYTEAYNVCSLAAGPQCGSAVDAGGETAGEEDQGRTSEEEDGGADSNYDKQPDGRSRAFYVAKELVDTERLHVKALKRLQEDFREAVGSAVGDEGEPVLEEERLREILNELPDVYALHRQILTELENRLRHWDESQRIADIFLSRKAEFLVFTTYIGHYDRSVSLLESSCRSSPAFAAIVHQFEQSPPGEKVCVRHQLLQVIVRVAQYRMLLTDYLNNLSPDSREYEDTQAAVVVVSDIADQVNDSLQHGENLLRLVNIEYSVRGQRDLLQPGRVFVKEGTLMKVSRKSRQPRHLFLMNDVLLYTFPQQDGKYRLKNSVSLAGLKVSKPVIENVQNALKIEASDVSITLSASSFIEREDWFYTLNRTVTEHARKSTSGFNSCSGEARDRTRLCLGEKAPTLVPVSEVMMCMNCTSDFSLTLRRHHCHGCGRIVCRSCSRNRYPLKYMKDRMAKVCDHCYNELTKRGGEVPALAGKNSPRPNRSSRPLSAMFQSIHPPNIWRHRKGTVTFNQVTVSEEGSISGTLQRSKKSKRNWKRLWFLLKDKVLYTYQAQEEKVASESLPLLGFTVKLPDRQQGEDGPNVFQLYHKNTLYYSFKAEDNRTARRWANAMEEATVL
ncbi:FYVE, RhoGEF and PH domain-containing protein 5-like isoform X2 [Betta splendens]|uniref:FYVE, RhoGEF and PH domain-containing protein 5-like isoform X2 n=1 Tax=Betta splendens TaxID=158456 RepID=A0A6P7ML47_BETSP|nr:FYVE, RhoGEF and PH domain-containing protein 5-like isoform X2 [Betta splendens]